MRVSGKKMLLLLVVLVGLLFAIGGAVVWWMMQQPMFKPGTVAQRTDLTPSASPTTSGKSHQM